MSTIASPRTKEFTRSAPSQNIEKRRHSENIPSRIVPQDPNTRRCTTPNQEVKSKYCVEEINKPEFGRRPKRNDSAPAKISEPKVISQSLEELRHRDAMFLRKMLAMNKKQEMMLNKRLASLMEEDEFLNVSDKAETIKKVTEQTLPEVEVNTGKCTKLSGNAKNDIDVVPKPNNKHPSSKIRAVDEKKLSKTAAARNIQYDINGRRIYNYNDIEKESTEEETELIREMDSKTKEKSTSNSTKINKKGSANSKKTFTMKKSLTYINKEGRVLKKSVIKNTRKEGRVRKEDGDSANSENPLEFSLRPKKVDSQGDGTEVENVIVHCSTVYSSNSSSKKNIKVWNYGSLHSLKSDKSIEKNKTILSDQRLSSDGGSNRPISVRNNNFQIQFRSPPTRSDERASKTVETVFLLRNKYNNAEN